MLSGISKILPGKRVFRGNQLPSSIKAAALLLLALTSLSFAAENAPAEVTKKTKITRAEITALIKEKGKTPPDWWDSVPLDYPKTMDLTWKKPPRGSGWNPRKNIGQYLWSRINPNPARWKPGIKFLHHVLSVNRRNPDAVQKAKETLAKSYHMLLQDYARGAFWYKKSRGRNAQTQLNLATCYWKLGSKVMAKAILRKIGPDRTANGGVIKLWADMGDLKKALLLAKAKAKTGMPVTAYLAAGDACRIAEQYEKALSYYEKSLAATSSRERPKHLEKNKERAKASVKAIKLFDTLDLTKIQDGVYAGDSIAYAGQLFLEVTVKDHRIESVTVTKHKDKQFYAALTDTPNQIIKKQSIKGIDAVTGATITSEAVINATAKALASGMK